MFSLELLGTIVGLVYLWLEYKASIHLWIAGIIMPAIYIFVYYEAGLYADFGINIYFLIAAIYGWLSWKNHKTDEDTATRPITITPKRLYLALFITFSACFLGIAWILIAFTNSDVPWLDSFTTALSIVGMWMLAKKYLEQWLTWIVVDVVSAGLYVYKDLYLTAGLYALYTVIAVLGYYNWKKMMLNGEE